MKHLRNTLLAAAAMVVATPASATTFELIDYNGSVANTPAAQGFAIAAAYWSSILTSNSTIRLEIGYNALAPNIIGSTGSTKSTITTSTVVSQMVATGNSAIDAAAVSSIGLTPQGGITMITSGYDTPASKLGINIATKVFDNDNSANNTTLGVNTALAKALGFNINYNNVPNQRDGQVNFSTNFAFDFDPTDGITAGTMDFIGVAIHEIGHALGFVSGVDIYDNPNNVNANNVNANGSSGLFSTLDLFRYSTDPTNAAPGTGPVRDLSAGGTPAYFSLDGGLTQLFGNSQFSTGANYGDGRQASHWKDATGPCPGTPQIGIMDPTFCYGQIGEITALDIAAMDAMGWNVSFNPLTNPNYRISTVDIYRLFGPQANAVPESTTWAMMIAGFGLMGAAMRRRRVKTTVSFA